MSAARGARALTLAAALLGPAAGAAGQQRPLFEPPAPGSYELPVIDRVQDRVLEAAQGAREPLLGLAPGEAALVSFIYRACSDAAGCPAALAALHGVDTALAERPELAERVQLVTVSFDPEHDTPERMAELRAHLAPRGRWRFLTSRDPAALPPLLADFGQNAEQLADASGEPTGAIRHVVKLYLVDAAGAVRNIYSSGLLHVPLLLADLQTVLAPPAPR